MAVAPVHCVLTFIAGLCIGIYRPVAVHCDFSGELTEAVARQLDRCGPEQLVLPARDYDVAGPNYSQWLPLGLSLVATLVAVWPRLPIIVAGERRTARATASGADEQGEPNPTRRRLLGRGVLPLAGERRIGQ